MPGGIRKACFVVLLMSVSGAAWADVVVLKNGDRITGQVTGLDGGKLAVKTLYEGKVRIKWGDVSTLSTDEPVYLMIDETSRVRATMAASETGKVALGGGDWLGKGPLALGRITGLTRKPGPVVKVHGRVNVGASKTSGNTDTKKLHMDAEVVARTVKNRFTIGGAVNRAEDRGVETESNSLAHLKYDHFVTKKSYLYSNANLEKDKFKDVKMRTALGAGAGVQFFEGEKTNLSLEAGVNHVNSDYYTAADESYAAARWAVRFDHRLFGSAVQFFHRHEGYLGFEDVDDIFLRLRTGLRCPLGHGLNASVQHHLDWDNDPAPGRSRGDHTYLLAIGYRW